MKTFAAGLLLALALPAPLALAQPQPQPWAYYPHAAPPPGAIVRGDPRGPYGRPPGPVCVPWCRSDTNPCDPPAFKQADGRCFQDN